MPHAVIWIWIFLRFIFFLKVLTSPSWGNWLTHFFPSHNLEVVFWPHPHLFHPKTQKCLQRVISRSIKILGICYLYLQDNRLDWQRFRHWQKTENSCVNDKELACHSTTSVLFTSIFPFLKALETVCKERALHNGLERRWSQEPPHLCGELERNLFFAQVREIPPFYAPSSQICPLLQNETTLSVSFQAVYYINIFENIRRE